MSNFLTLFAISVPIFIVCDLVWLGVLARDFYRTHLGYLLGEVVWIPAIIFYAVFIFGLTYFVTFPLVDTATLKHVALQGALFGLMTYATYDLTNHATIKGWPYHVTVVDILWGTALGALVSVFAVYVYRLFA